MLRSDGQRCHTAVLRVNRRLYDVGFHILYSRTFEIVVSARGTDMLFRHFAFPSRGPEPCAADYHPYQHFPFHLVRKLRVSIWPADFRLLAISHPARDYRAVQAHEREICGSAGARDCLPSGKSLYPELMGIWERHHHIRQLLAIRRHIRFYRHRSHRYRAAHGTIHSPARSVSCFGYSSPAQQLDSGFLRPFRP